MISVPWVVGLSTATVGAFAVMGIAYSRGKVLTVDDFVTARGSAGPWMLAATLLASFLGVFILFTPAEAGIVGGLPAIIGYALGVGTLYLAFLVVSPRIRAYLPMGSSLTDFAWQRYGRGMYGLTVLLSLFYMFVHLVAELTAIGLVAHQLAGVPLFYTALLIGLGTMAYTAYGGLKASMFTDTIQMGLMLFLLAVFSGGIFSHLGGVGEVVGQIREVAPQLLDLANWSGIEYGLTLCIAVFSANMFHQGYWQRIYAGRDNASLRWALATAILLAIPIMFVAGFLGIVAAGFKAVENPSTAVFSLLTTVFPSWFILAVFLLALVLVMSTVDTLLNAMAATISIDCRRLFPRFGEDFLLRLSRFLTVLLVMPAILIAARGYSVLYLFLIADLVCAAALFPLFYGFYSERHTGSAALVAFFLGIIAGIPFFSAGKLFYSFSTALLVSASICLLAAFAGGKRGLNSLETAGR